MSDSGEFVDIFAGSERGACAGMPHHEILADVAERFENLDPAARENWRATSSAIAADLAEPPAVRKLAATVAYVMETAATGLTDWDALYDLAEASEAVRLTKRRNHAGD